jgi:hypothetical protein
MKKLLIFFITLFLLFQIINLTGCNTSDVYETPSTSEESIYSEEETNVSAPNYSTRVFFDSLDDFWDFANSRQSIDLNSIEYSEGEDYSAVTIEELVGYIRTSEIYKVESSYKPVTKCDENDKAETYLISYNNIPEDYYLQYLFFYTYKFGDNEISVDVGVLNSSAKQDFEKNGIMSLEYYGDSSNLNDKKININIEGNSYEAILRTGDYSNHWVPCIVFVYNENHIHVWFHNKDITEDDMINYVESLRFTSVNNIE